MNIVKYRAWWLGFSGLLVVASLAAIFTYGYRLGIDFAGGTNLEVQLREINTEALETGLEEYLVTTYKDVTGFDTAAQSTGEDRYLLKSQVIDNDTKNNWITTISANMAVDELRFETVSPVIGGEAVRKTILAVLLAIIVILLYLAYSFRKVPKPASAWRFGVATIIALTHDVIILMGTYAILGQFFGAEVDAMFMTAMLTLLGFSVHDTIVTFDRLRENLIRQGGDNFATKVNNSIIETITRSINTSFTVVLVLLAMVLMGGGSIFFFTLSLLIGIIIGTYSSIFVASMVLLWWQSRAERALLKQ
ncbi:MAG: protein translocase subunit SecF [Patescibacteria group bacterium]